MDEGTRPDGRTWRQSAETALRQLSAITVAGAVLGVLVGGVGGRLAMFLLAVLNRRTTGMVSDDGFVIGTFTLAGSLNLLLVGGVLGLLGAGIYAALRGLSIGPRWFQVLSISVGPGVVTGAMLVHTSGVDFVFLRPLWLSVALFVLLPTVYCALLTVLAERWLGPDSPFRTGRLATVTAPLVLWVPLAPVAAALVVGWVGSEWLRRHRAVPPMVITAVVPWVARTALAVVFVAAAVDLWRDVDLLAAA